MLELGPHHVGFRCESLSRTSANESPGTRTLTLCVWYPAVGGTGLTARIADLFDIALEENQLTETHGLSKAQGLVAAMTGDADALPLEEAEEALTLPVRARLQAEPLSQRSPLALWSTRHATVLAQAPLSEALASHGFVVATVWSSDPPLAFLWEDHPEAEKVATIESHADDLQYGLARLRERSDVDPDRTVVLSWSYGGQTAARLQEREGAILGVIGLDANVVPAREEERLELRVPLVWLLGRDSGSRGLDHVGDLDASAVVVVVQLYELAHGNFNALEGFLPGLLETDTVFPWSSGGEAAVRAYGAVTRITIEAVTLLTAPRPSFAELGARLCDASAEVPVRILYDGSAR